MAPLPLPAPVKLSSSAGMATSSGTSGLMMRGGLPVPLRLLTRLLVPVLQPSADWDSAVETASGTCGGSGAGAFKFVSDSDSAAGTGTRVSPSLEGVQLQQSDPSRSLPDCSDSTLLSGPLGNGPSAGELVTGPGKNSTGTPLTGSQGRPSKSLDL